MKTALAKNESATSGRSGSPFFEKGSKDSLRSKTTNSPFFNSAKGSGSPLSDTTRQQMESSFGTNFSQVRIHSDSAAVQMNKDLNAQAFTHGSDIYFNEGKYDTNSKGGNHLLAHELTHVVQQNQAPHPQIFRKVSVENPDKPIPNPDGTGLVQTNQLTVLEYVSRLCPDTDFIVADGHVDLLDTAFCFPGVKQLDGSFKSPSVLSNHPVSCECLCEMIMDPLRNIIIRINDNLQGVGSTQSSGTNAVITVPSPNAPSQLLRGSSGSTISNTPPFIILGHELCGHFWLEMRGSDERENLQNPARGGHDPAIKRENLIRQEHGLEKRGTFRNPCCGMNLSTAEDLKKTSGKCGDTFEKQKNIKGTDQYECKHWRDEYNKLNGTHFTTDDTIPDQPNEKLPAKWRLEIYFNKDMPQSWHTLTQSLTEDGMNNFLVVDILLHKHPELKAQLAGNASSDKPKHDPTYNQRLAKRRALLVRKALVDKNTGEKRFQTFDSDCEKLQEGVHNCSDQVSEVKSNQLDRNVEVKLFE